MKNLKVRTKMLIAFAIITLISVIIGVIGSINLGISAAKTKQSYEQMTVPIGQIGVIIGNFYYNVSVTNKMCNELNADQFQAMKDDLAAHSSET